MRLIKVWNLITKFKANAKLIMTLLITDLLMTLLRKINKKHICNDAFINVLSKVVISRDLITIAQVSLK